MATATIALTRWLWARLVVRCLAEAVPRLPWWQRAPAIIGVLSLLARDLWCWETRAPALAAELEASCAEEGCRPSGMVPDETSGRRRDVAHETPPERRPSPAREVAR